MFSIALGPARDEVEDPVSHVLASRRRRGVPPLAVVPHATPKSRERVHEDDAIPATGDRPGRPRRRFLAELDSALRRSPGNAHRIHPRRCGIDSDGTQRSGRSEKRDGCQTDCGEEATQGVGSGRWRCGTSPTLTFRPAALQEWIDRLATISGICGCGVRMGQRCGARGRVAFKVRPMRHFGSVRA